MPEMNTTAVSSGAGMGGFASMAIGAIAGAVASRDAASAQRQMLSAQAQMDKLNAKSMAMSMDGNADIELVNTKAGFESMQTNSTLNAMSVDAQAFSNEAGAQFGLNRAENSFSMNLSRAEHGAAMSLNSAETSAKMGELQANSAASGLHIGAAMDRLDASLFELQAQSSLQHGEYQEQDVRMQYAQAKSRAVASMARGNVDMSEGTSLMVRAGVDIMAERSAIQVQQTTLMQAFSQRVQEQKALMSASAKDSQANSLVSMSKLSGQLNINAAKFSGGVSIAETRLAGENAVGDAQYAKAATIIGDNYQRAISTSQTDWTSAMVKAGLASAETTAAYKHTMAKIMLNNSSAAALIKQSMADGISPSGAFASSLLASSGQVASAWYQYNKTTG